MNGFIHGTKLIAREQGLRGFFKGFVPTTARQAANSAVRFSSYTSLRQLAQGYVAPGEKLGALSTFGIGGVAGIITVYVSHVKSTSSPTDPPTDMLPCLWTLSRQECSLSKQKPNTKTAFTAQPE
jgi:hypothetical protein